MMERVKRLAGNKIEPGMMIPMIESRASNIPMTIYESLPLDHFETPRHVHDHIRDSELPSVHQNT